MPPQAFSITTAISVVGVGGKADIYYVEAHAGQSGGDKVRYHRAGEAGIASYYDYVSLTGGVFF